MPVPKEKRVIKKFLGGLVPTRAGYLTEPHSPEPKRLLEPKATEDEVKWFTDGAQFNTNHEMLIWLWSSSMARSNWCTRFVFACIPMRYLPSKALRAKANKAIVQCIAWDSI